MGGRPNRPRRLQHYVRPSNLKTYLYCKSLQRGYNQRIQQWKSHFMGVSPVPSIPKPLHEFHPNVGVNLIKHFEIQVGDLVKIRWGPDRNKRGIVLATIQKKNQLIIEGCGMRKQVTNPYSPQHGKPSKIYLEGPIHITNVLPLDPVTKTTTTLKYRQLLTGERIRLSSVSGSVMPEPVPIAKACRNNILYYKRNALTDYSKPLPKITVTDSPTADKRCISALQTLSLQSLHRKHIRSYYNFIMPSHLQIIK